ncbi:MAG: D-glycero-beta-D-manno-heptose 1,7-bisphosphate 7-phosphatase [Anaeroplasma sp.]
MQAIILAGGFGTRLQSVVSNVPKPMAPINNKPFLEYVLNDLNDYGFTKVILAVGYKSNIIYDYFGEQFKNITLVYSYEDSPLGTGGCVKQALSYVDDDFVFILNGDTMFKIDYDDMANNNCISIAVKKMKDFDRYGEIVLKDDLIISFKEKCYVKQGFINGGVYYLPKNIFNGYNLPERFSIEKDFFEKYIDKLNIKAYKSYDYFIDIGIPNDYEKAKQDFKMNKALFLDRDGIINIDYGHVHKIEDFVLTSNIIDLCKKYQKKNYLIFVITNQAGIGKGLYTTADFNKLTDYMLDLFKSNGIVITKVYYCPHKPEENCECRKPKSKLFFNAITEYNINPQMSVAIGDKLSDLEAAFNAGIENLFFKKTKYEEYLVNFDYKYLK